MEGPMYVGTVTGINRSPATETAKAISARKRTSQHNRSRNDVSSSDDCIFFHSELKFLNPGVMAGLNLRHIKVSAPGKIILHGEHAVVYQKTAIALSLGLRTRLDLRETNDGRVTIFMERFFKEITWKTDDLTSLLETTKVDAETLETTLDQELLDRLQQLVGSSLIQDVGIGNGDGSDVQFRVEAAKLKDPSTQSIALVGFLYLLIKLCKLAGRSTVPSLSFAIQSEIAIGAGLGSSASLAVCLASAILAFLGVIVVDAKTCRDSVGKLVPQADQLALINHWAFLVDKIIHGNASGIDNSVSTYGGVIKFANGQMTRVQSRLKLDVVVVDTGVERNTKRMVEIVRRRKKLYPLIINPILDAIDGISNTSFTLLQHGNGSPTAEEYEALSELISINQHLLCVLGVSHPGLDAICATAARLGQAAKLTGAGGGGCAIVVLDPDIIKFERLRESMMTEFRQLEFKPHTADLGGPGVLFHPVS
ncbi:putative Mevalonate kinase [Hypsibius exemplaris]|uniref:Mevalonate kinase n=1 Tax=Hypsibius exemplaris TaxID=2072580 RepID=A0A1W0X3S1_HYPEX|nr:putative Mevalonate kinase [Hypsibius exemplaris]